MTIQPVAVTCSSSQPGEGACQELAAGGLWVSSWDPYVAGPHFVDFDLGEPRFVRAMRYFPRQDGGTNGTIGCPPSSPGCSSYRLDLDGVPYASGGGVYQPPAPVGDAGFTVLLDPPRAVRRLRLWFLRTIGGQGPATWASASRLEIEAGQTAYQACGELPDPCLFPVPCLSWSYDDPAQAAKVDGYRLWCGHGSSYGLEPRPGDGWQPDPFQPGYDPACWPLARSFEAEAGTVSNCSVSAYNVFGEGGRGPSVPICWPCVWNVDREPYAAAAARCRCP